MSLSTKQLALLPVHNIFQTKEDLKQEEVNKELSVILSKAVKAPFHFDSLVLSVSAKLNKKSAILVQAAVKTSKGWSGMYKMFYISADYKKTFNNKPDEFAKIDTDILLPKEPVQYFKYQITVLGKANINLVCATVTQAKQKYNAALALETLDLKDFVLPFTPISQMEFKDKNLKNKICSPAAVAAVLNYYGKKVTLEETTAAVLDQNTAAFGTWPFNTAFAAQQGLNSCVVRCSSLAQAEGEIYQGRPVIVSIAYKAGKLKGAPVKETKGHLVTIIGFDKNGNVVAADSAAKTAKQAIITYDRKEFAQAWIKNKKGIAYAIEE